MNWGSLSQDSLVQVNGILNKLKKYDEGTYQHCLRVSQMSRFLAEHAQLSEYECLVAQIAGLLHDVGKMETPLDILNKPAKLTDDEYKVMKTHAESSAEMIEPLCEDPFFRDVQMAVLHHHERMDGRGYPDGLYEEEIPYISRLILIVDTVDAMTQSRAYRKGLPVEVAYQELDRCAGTQFDKELVGVFIRAHMEFGDPLEKGNIIKLPFLVNAA